MPSLKEEVMTLLVSIKRDMSIAAAKIERMNESARSATIYLDRAHDLVARCQQDIEARGNEVIPTIQRRF